MSSSFENVLRSELNHVDTMRREIVEDLKSSFMRGSNPDLWRHSNGLYVLMPLTVARAQLLSAIAIERNSKK
jgi:hypothetical protein